MKTREFHLGDILSITTERLVSPRHMDGVRDILDFMTGANLFTHQLSRACGEMKPRLLSQHPQLATVDASVVSKAWLAEQCARYGETLMVQAEHQFHQVKDPIAEAEELVGPERILLVTV